VIDTMADIKKDDNTKETTNFRNQLNFLYGIIDVARLVYERKVSFILITAIVLGITVLYSVFAQPIYKATATLKPPPDVKTGSTGVGGWCPRMSGEDIFRDFRSHISNTAKRQKFFQLPEIYNLLNENQPTPYIEIDFDRNDRLTFELYGPSVELTKILADKYIAITKQESLTYAIKNIEDCLQAELTNLEESLAAERIFAQTELELKIKTIEEAKVIAETLGLYEYDPRVPEFPYFARGVKALNAEIAFLGQKSIADTLSPRVVRDLNSIRTVQRMLATDNWKTHAVSAEIEIPTDVASKPVYYSIPIFRSRPFIWMIGLIVGLLLSFFFVVAANELRMNKRR